MTPQMNKNHGKEPAPKSIFENAKFSQDILTPNSANKKLMDLLPQLNHLTQIAIQRNESPLQNKLR